MPQNLEQPTEKTHEEINHVFYREYPGGINDPQGGKFQVWAGFIDANGEEKPGGGWVMSFNTQEDAQSCMDIVNEANPNHKPILEEMKN